MDCNLNLNDLDANPKAISILSEIDAVAKGDLSSLRSTQFGSIPLPVLFRQNILALVSLTTDYHVSCKVLDFFPFLNVSSCTMCKSLVKRIQKAVDKNIVALVNCKIN